MLHSGAVERTGLLQPTRRGADRQRGEFGRVPNAVRRPCGLRRCQLLPKLQERLVHDFQQHAVHVEEHSPERVVAHDHSLQGLHGRTLPLNGPLQDLR